MYQVARVRVTRAARRLDISVENGGPVPLALPALVGGSAVRLPLLPRARADRHTHACPAGPEQSNLIVALPWPMP
jgi:hypothetical protein